MKESQTQNTRSCPRCEQPLPSDAPEGICPECIMLEGLETVPIEDRPERLPTALPATGDVFGNYRIGRELGRGGMGAVYEAEQIDTGRRVALKILNHQLDSPEARARFLREGRLAASINHPGSVYVFGTEEIGDMPAIAMELVAGGNLQEKVKEEGPLAVGEAVDYILQIISGLEAAQEIGILHRDIKPANCFQDIDGSVKIGDFGLSISVEAREETQITLDGTVFGTPAFASPEQLRGDELNVRSDIYAVGATLFFLLTGAAPFRGKSLHQLFANVLEKKAPSCRESRPEVPVELAGVVNRCLSKAPSDRFGSYAELRAALAPFSLETPVPAPISLRFGAGVIDWFLYTALMFAIQMLIWGTAAIMTGAVENYVGLMIFGLVGWVLYFTLLEGRKGFSIGKLICRLRVTGPDRNPPGYWKAAIRAFLMISIPTSLIWIVSFSDPLTFFTNGTNPFNMTISLSYYVILALLFVTARRRNGLASIVDLWTSTRVVRRVKIQERPISIIASAEPVAEVEEKEIFGPFRVLDVVEKSSDFRWLIGYDSRLLRRVWLRIVPPGTDSVSTDLRQLSRVGRLRWIAGQRKGNESWDAYESPGGQSFLSLTEQKSPSWDSVRYWLLDLAQELSFAEEDGRSPILSLSRIWITEKNRAKLLDFPAPGNSEESETVFESSGDFLAAVSKNAETPIPLHAAEVQRNFGKTNSSAAHVSSISTLIDRVTKVTKERHAAMVVSCMIFPVLASVMLMLGVQMMVNFQEKNPNLMELNTLLAFRHALQSPLTRGGRDVPSDRIFKIYIAENYRDLIENPEKWEAPTIRILIGGEKRAFAEQSLSASLKPTEEEIQEAASKLDPVMKNSAIDMTGHRWFPIPAGIGYALFLVALPAIFSAVAFRRGLVMLICGVVVARPDGAIASRPRTLWRSIIAWSPLPLSLILMLVLSPSTGPMVACIIGGFLLLAIISYSVWLPGRSLQDRIAGTCLLPQ